jgi:hypothetical protein
MKASEALINIELATNGSRAQQFLNEVKTIMDHPGSYIDCPDCSGEGGMSWVCEMCGGEGCRHCNLGLVFLPCKTCKGRKQVFKTDDELEGVWE